MVNNNASNWKPTEPSAPRPSDCIQPNTSRDRKVGRPVNFRQKSMIETVRNIRYSVAINPPAWARPSISFFGLARTSGSRNNNPISVTTANQPALPASPAAFCNNCKIHGNEVTRHPVSVITRSAPNRPPIRPQPTSSFEVNNKTRINRIGPKIISKLSLSCRSITMSSVILPIGSIPCLRAWNDTDKNRQKK